MAAIWDTLWANARVATLVPGQDLYGMIEEGAVAVHRGRVAWVGKTADLRLTDIGKSGEIRDCLNRLVTPGLIDCHTHLVYAGNRANEFERRLRGATYEEIAAAGGGIMSTVEQTREASEGVLFTQASKRLQTLMDEGVTTVEIKSGYGLDTATEMKMLRVARRLGDKYPVTVKTTFLGAHAVAPEFQDRADDYIEMVCSEMLPAIAKEKLADAVDAFCETIAFSVKQVEKVFHAASRLGLPVKIHAEQLSNQQGAAMAATYSALSADHLEHLDDDGAAALGRNGTVAVLLPGAFYTLRESRVPPLEALRANGVPLAVATDANPGSSPVSSLLLMMNMACNLFRLTPEEALAGVTRNAAKALGMDDQVGTIQMGRRADLVLWDVDDPAELSYRLGGNPCLAVMAAGSTVDK
jgi:imidazolonepropionase